MHLKSNQYRSYLLRLWKDGEGSQYIMAERITPPRDRFYFTSLDDLFLFLLKDQRSDPESLDADSEE